MPSLDFQLVTPLLWQMRRAALAAAAWSGLVVAATGQSRGGDEELLLSYRRGDIANAAGTTNNSSAASNAGGVENPLRQTADPTPIYRFDSNSSRTTPDAQPVAPRLQAVPPAIAGNVAPPLPGPQTSGENSPSSSPYANLPATALPVTAPLTPVVDAPSTAPPAIQSSPPAAMPEAQLLHYDGALQQAQLVEPAEPATAQPVEFPALDAKSVEPAPQESVSAPPLAAAAPLPQMPVAPVSDESRRLAPRTVTPDVTATASPGMTEGLKQRLPISFSKFDSLTTAGAGLAVVVGLFFVCMWLLRRSSGSKPTGALPQEAFAVLGRAPLTPQSFAQLLRVGNKLVLVSVSADGIQPLTEVVDPLEVDRLTSVCASGRGHGPAAEFQQVLAQLAREPARGFLGAEAANGGGRRRA